MRLSLISLAAALALVVSTASLATALGRHDAWEGMVLGSAGSKIRGDVAMSRGAAPKATIVSISYKQDVAGALRPWHVHVGSCAKPGPVLGDPSAYAALKVAPDGTTKGKATLALAWPSDGDFYVSIHESAANMRTIVACGDLLMHE